jgi:uncharacterized protein (TIGR03437 family)
MVSIFGTEIGPAPSLSLALDHNGDVSTTLGGVEVTFNGIPAPLTYVSKGQVNAVVPYETAGFALPYVQLKYLGQASNSLVLETSTASPALFTLDGSGSGPAAVVNQDGSINGTDHPAPRGTQIVLYLTGEGQTSPRGVTGKVTTVSAGKPITAEPLLPVAVAIDGEPASITFCGEAPTFVSGVLQINVLIPAGASQGDLPLQVSIGSKTTQAGVTVSVR